MLNTTQLLITISFIFCSSIVKSQIYDSVVKIDMSSFEDKILGEHYTQVISYINGQEIKNLKIEYKGKFWKDSLIIENYFDNGKKIRSVTQNIQHGLCKIPKDSNYYYVPLLQSFTDSTTWVQYQEKNINYRSQLAKQNIELKDGYYYCPLKRTTTTSYSESIKVTTTIESSFGNRGQNVTVDSIFYMGNGLISNKSTYRMDKKVYQSEYSYRLDKDKRITEKIIKEKYQFEPISTIIETLYRYSDTVKLEFSKKRYLENDSSNFSGYFRQYNNEDLLIKIDNYANGIISDYTILKYFKGKCYVDEECSYSSDTVLIYSIKTIKRIRKKREEIWEYFYSSLNSESTGYYYSQKIRSKLKKGYSISEYLSASSARNMKKKKGCSKSNCNLRIVTIFDNENRILRSENYDQNTGKLISTTSFKYSK